MTMSLIHRDGNDKEFISWIGAALRCGMSSLIPLLALSIGGWPASFTQVRIALALDAVLPAAVARGAVAEAAALWAPYRVAVVTLQPTSTACGPARLGEAVLTVRVAEPGLDTARAWSSPFAAIRFLADGEPEPTILLHYDAVIKRGLGTLSVGGTREPQWPKAVRDRILGRMIGRVLAHEIGHWVLRSRDHSTSGLMRAQQTTDALAEPGRARFALAPADVARLRAALAR
jgi:hypothetical protein